MKRIIFLIISLAVIIVIIMSSIDINNDKTTVTSNEVNYIYSLKNIPRDLSKAEGLTKEDGNILYATCRSILVLKADGTLQNDLADEVTLSEDKIQYEIKLREDITWSDGKKITGEDILDFLKELIKIEDEKDIEALLQVFGAKEYKGGNGSFKNNVAITCEGNIIKIRLNKPNENFLYELTKPQYRVRKSLQLWSDIKTYYKDLVYSGDFIISDIQDESMSLKLRGEEKSENILLTLDESSEFAMAQYEINKRDMVIDPPKNELQKLKSRNKLITTSSRRGLYFILNDIKDSSSSVNQRKNIYKEFCEAIKEYEDINPGYIEESEGSYFIEDKKLLEKLQERKVYLNENLGESDINLITILAIDNAENRYLCEFFKEWFKEVHNTQIRYTLVDKEEFKDTELRSRYHIVMLNFEDNKERKNFYKEILDYLNEDEVLNLDSYNNEELNIIENRIYNEIRVVPLFFYNKNIAISEKISDIATDGHGNIIFQSIK